MIEITNEKECIYIKKKDLKKIRNNYKIIIKNQNICIDLLFVYKKMNDKNIIIRIEKRLKSSGNSNGDLLKTYLNLMESENKVFLCDSDYYEIKRLVTNLQIGDDVRINTIVDCYAYIMAYECYMDYVIEELEEISIGHILKDVTIGYFSSKELTKYKNVIFNKAKEVLKEKYKVNLDSKFKEERKNE